MPNYKTGKRKKKSKRAKTAETTRMKKRPSHITSDRRILLSWAVRGTPVEFAKFRDYALKARRSLPVWIDGVAYDKLLHTDRGKMITDLQDAEVHADPDASASAFVDALNWLLDWVPPVFNFGTKIWQQSMSPYQGDSENAVDRTYAGLVGATYDGTRPYVVDHYKRQDQFDGEYIAVWDSPDGHRLIAVRGTKWSHLNDVGQDLRIAFTGSVGDAVSGEILRVLAATGKDVVVDLAAHSLGTSLALKAYDTDPRLYNRIHETYLYNPAYSPLVGSAMIARYEADDNVRFFVNTGDLVSIGGLGLNGPVNAVYHHDGSHNLSQWQWPKGHTGNVYYNPPPDRVHPTKQIVPLKKQQEEEEDETDPDDPGDLAGAGVQDAGDVQVDFGNEGFEQIIASL